MNKKQFGEECAYCAIKADGNRVTLKKCSKCLLVSYCCKECQRFHWTVGEHKRFCLSPSDRTLLTSSQSVDDVSFKPSQECSICREEIAEGSSFTLSCAHKFHFDCLYIAGKLTPAKGCPICRTPLPSYLFSSLNQGWHMWNSLCKSFCHRTGRKNCSYDQLNKSERKQAEGILEILETAAKGGNAHAMYTLGRTFEEGILVKPDSYTSRKWFEKGAKKGHAQSQTALGVMYFDGQGGLKSNVQVSVDYFSLAASQGESEAMHRLGIMFRYGSGILRDDAKAYSFFETCAYEHNNLDAHFEIGLLLYEGLYLPRCFKKAAFTFMYCAFLGHCGGQFMMSEFFLRGIGVKQDESKACFWRSKASLQIEQEGDKTHKWISEWLDLPLEERLW